MPDRAMERMGAQSKNNEIALIPAKCSTSSSE
jgi:hypothetical protein